MILSQFCLKGPELVLHACAHDFASQDYSLASDISEDCHDKETTESLS